MPTKKDAVPPVEREGRIRQTALQYESVEIPVVVDSTADAAVGAAVALENRAMVDQVWDAYDYAQLRKAKSIKAAAPAPPAHAPTPVPAKAPAAAPAKEVHIEVGEETLAPCEKCDKKTHRFPRELDQASYVNKQGETKTAFWKCDSCGAFRFAKQGTPYP